ncbi:MAG: YggS family pyridoxal phosphate enzyme [Acidimicrobiales bacterium]|jgi:pyridoxal phosphate enzyme (YggS family)
MSELAELIAARVSVAKERIAKAGGDPGSVKIVAVTKGFGPAQVAAAFEAGIRDFGENYADELVEKWPSAPPPARWHFLGTVQRNKIRRLAPYVDCWQAVARVLEGETILRHREEPAPGRGGGVLAPASMLVEVETTGLSGRGGCPPADVEAVVGGLLDRGCQVDGLMTVAAPDDPAGAGAAFQLVARLARQLGLAELSMGMSEDLEQAVAAGATMVRLGTCLFGPRPQRRRL